MQLIKDKKKPHQNPTEKLDYKNLYKNTNWYNNYAF